MGGFSLNLEETAHKIDSYLDDEKLSLVFGYYYDILTLFCYMFFSIYL